MNSQLIINKITGIKKKALSVFKPEYLIVACFLSVAIFYIFDHIGLRAFWSDEADVANTINNSFIGLWRWAIIDGHPLFYLYFLKIWSVIFGDSETALRSFSAFFALATIVALYVFGTKIFLNRKTGLIAAGLMSTNYFLIWFATQNKVYTFSALLGLLSCYFFIRLVMEKTNRTALAGYIAFTVLAAYTHPWQILVFGGQIISFLLLVKYIENRKKTWVAFIIAGLLIIPALIIYYYQGQLGASAWITKAGLSALIASFKYLTYGSSAVYLLLSLVAIPFTITAHKAMPPSEKRRELILTVILGMYLFIPLFCALLVSQFKPIYVIGRYEMIVLPALIIIVARLWSCVKQEWFFFMAGFLLVIMTTREVVSDRDMVKSYVSTDKIVAQEIMDKISGRSTVIATDLSYATFNYYLPRMNREKNTRYEYSAFPNEIMTHPGWISVGKMIENRVKYESEAGELIESISRKGVDFVWVIYRENELNAILRDALKNHYLKEDIIQINSPRMPSWFDYLILYQR